MKKLGLLLLALLVLWCGPATAQAESREDYEEAYKLRLAAGACVAAYSARTGTLAREYLRQDGWEIRPFVMSTKRADARVLLAEKTGPNGHPLYILAVVGTETIKDVKVDLRTDKVYFAGGTPEEFEINARLTDRPGTDPKVHRGFHEYVQAAFTATTPDTGAGGERSLSELLLADTTSKVYIVGHSLGGAAATVGAARLVAMGVKPEQIEVVTFGAPAVGNEAYGRLYEPLLNLTRVVIAGDPVTGILQKLVGGYRQFGREVVWQRSALVEKSPHAVEEYLDLALKQFYDKRAVAMRAGLLSLPVEAPAGMGPRVYVAPLVNSLPPGLHAEFRYMEQGLADEYRRLVPGYVLGEPGAKTAAGSRWHVVTQVGGHRQKNEYNQYFITLQQTIYDPATGQVVGLGVYSSLTANMTPLEALLHSATAAAGDLAGWLAQTDRP